MIYDFRSSRIDLHFLTNGRGGERRGEEGRVEFKYDRVDRDGVEVRE